MANSGALFSLVREEAKQANLVTVRRKSLLPIQLSAHLDAPGKIAKAVTQPSNSIEFNML